MNASLRTLLSGIVDYAGLFPPAKLPLDQAIRNYARFRQEPDAWMLGRFVIPAARLSELDAFADLFQEKPPFRFSLLGRGGGGDDDGFVNGVAEDGRDAAGFCKRHNGHVQADVLETRLPNDYNFRWIFFAAGTLEPSRWNLFFESSPGRAAEGMIQGPLHSLAIVRDIQGPDYPITALSGFKLRTGGLEASAFPFVEQVAFVLHACRDIGVPLKFTAGLHHPIRRFDASVQTHMHGFINVFVAGVLAHARRLDEETLRAVVADEDPSHFRFTDDGLFWKDAAASTAEIAAARRDFVTSFGSCSFDEPRDDLRALGWL